jgi:hypothetical protein
MADLITDEEIEMDELVRTQMRDAEPVPDEEDLNDEVLDNEELDDEELNEEQEDDSVEDAKRTEVR